MKKIEIKSKLKLSKQIITQLNNEELCNLNGGCPADGATIFRGCDTNIGCVTMPGDCAPPTTFVP